MRISDWSSDVCSSDLFAVRCGHFGDAVGHYCNALATHRSESASHVEQANVRCAQHHGRVRVYRGGDAETPGHIRYGGEAHVDAQLRSYGIDRIGKSGADVDLPIEMARAVARLRAIDFDRFVHNGRFGRIARSEEHTSELQSLMRISYAVFCLKKKKNNQTTNKTKVIDTY